MAPLFDLCDRVSSRAGVNPFSKNPYTTDFVHSWSSIGAPSGHTKSFAEEVSATLMSTILSCPQDQESLRSHAVLAELLAATLRCSMEQTGGTNRSRGF